MTIRKICMCILLISSLCFVRTVYASRDPNTFLDMRATYHLAGIVTDANSFLLNDYQLTAETITFDATTKKVNRRRETTTLKNRFNIVTSNTIIARFIFSKKGYIPAEKRFTSLDLIRERRKEIDRKIRDGRLEPSAISNTPTKYYEKLAYSDPNMVIVLRRIKNKPLVMGEQFVRYVLDEENPVKEFDLPDYLDVERTGISIHLDVDKKTHQINRCYLKATVPARICLMQNTKYHEIVEAPSGDQYLNKVDLINIREYPCPVVFQTRDQYYLKCYLDVSIVKRKRRALVGFFDIALQPDGTRNLFTLEKSSD